MSDEELQPLPSKWRAFIGDTQVMFDPFADEVTLTDNYEGHWHVSGDDLAAYIRVLTAIEAKRAETKAEPAT